MPKNTLGFIPVVCYIMMIQGNVWYHQQLLLSSPSIQGTHFHQGHLRPGATDRLAPVGILLLLHHGAICPPFPHQLVLKLLLHLTPVLIIFVIVAALLFPFMVVLNLITLFYFNPVNHPKRQLSKVLLCLKFSPFPSIVPISILNCFWSIRRV